MMHVAYYVPTVIPVTPAQVVEALEWATSEDGRISRIKGPLDLRLGESQEPWYGTATGWVVAVEDDCGCFDSVVYVRPPGEKLFGLYPRWSPEIPEDVRLRFDQEWGLVRHWTPQTEEGFHRWGFGPETTPGGWPHVKQLQHG